MKTQAKILSLLIAILIFSLGRATAQSYSYKGMYVYTLDSILNDASGKTEDVLYRYCRDSSINALTLSVGAYNLNTSPSYVTKLASFIKKGRTRYGIKYFTAVFSDYATLQNEIRFYQNSRTDSLEKFSYYNYEFEYWNPNFYTATGSSETAYCTKYLQPSNCSCDSLGAWKYFSKYIKSVDSVAQVDHIKSCLYIGVKSKDTLKNRFIANTVDLIMIASYKSIPTDLYQTHTTGKLTAFSKANHKVDVIPIFSSLSQTATENLKEWLKGAAPVGKHAEASAMPYFMSEYNLLPASVRNNLNMIGYQWFKYGGMPKDSTFTAISITPTGLNAVPSATAASLSWTAVNASSNYVVWYAPANTFAWTKLSTTTNNLTLSGLTADNTYQYLVYAKTSSGNTASSQLASFTTTSVASTCAKVSGMLANAITSSGATLSWTAATGAASYLVKYKSVAQTVWNSVSTTALSQVVSGLSPATAYEFQIQTNCGGNSMSDLTASVNFTTAALACAVPTTLTSSTVTATSVTLGWSAISGAIGYVVSYRLGSAATWINQNVSVNTIALSGLQSAASYEFQVQTQCSASIQSSFSTLSSFTTANPVCAVPAGLAASGITSSTANISWNAVQYSGSYLVYYRVKGTSIWTNLSNTSLTASLIGLLPSSTYEYAVQSICSGTNSSSVSATSEFTTLISCIAPLGISVTAISAASATINWAAAANAVSYNVDYKLPSSLTWTTINTAALSQLISSLSAASTYDYRMQSVCATASSAYSTSSQFTTTALPQACDVPSGLTAGAISSTAATLNWNAVNGATGYKVQYRKVGTTIWTSKTVSTNTKAITALKSASVYEFKVQTTCSATLSSAYSTVFTFSTLGVTTKIAYNTYALRTSQGITINWSSTDEKNASYYSIEKSTDGLEFEPLGILSANQNTFTASDYEFSDGDMETQHASTSVWYKLSVIDEEGNQAYLRTIEVMPKTEFADEFKIYPNPNSGDQINLNVKVEKKEEILVVLMDIMGNRVYSKVVITDDNGSLATAINPTQELAKGIYQVVGYSSTKTLSQKLIVK